jgi:hypothetical protein
VREKFLTNPTSITVMIQSAIHHSDDNDDYQQQH